MEYVIKELLHPEEDDEANFIYSELDSQRRETRRVEFYPSGMCFAYGGDMGQDEVLDPTPFPEDLRTYRISRKDSGLRENMGAFSVYWERPKVCVNLQTDVR